MIEARIFLVVQGVERAMWEKGRCEVGSGWVWSGYCKGECRIPFIRYECAAMEHSGRRSDMHRSATSRRAR